MLAVRLPTQSQGSTVETIRVPVPESAETSNGSDAPAAELLDLYAAVAVVVPLALLLRWMWP